MTFYCESLTLAINPPSCAVTCAVSGTPTSRPLALSRRHSLSTNRVRAGHSKLCVTINTDILRHRAGQTRRISIDDHSRLRPPCMTCYMNQPCYMVQPPFPGFTGNSKKLGKGNITEAVVRSRLALPATYWERCRDAHLGIEKLATAGDGATVEYFTAAQFATAEGLLSDYYLIIV